MKDRDGRPAVRDPTFLAETQIVQRELGDRVFGVRLGASVHTAGPFIGCGLVVEADRQHVCSLLSSARCGEGGFEFACQGKATWTGRWCSVLMELGCWVHGWECSAGCAHCACTLQFLAVGVL